MQASEEVIKKYSSTFYFSFSPLPAYQADSIYVIYDFLRKLDNAADSNDPATFEKMVAGWNRVKNNQAQSDLEKNLRLVFTTFELPFYLIDDMINGQKHDLNREPINSAADLHEYCYQVAGTVGLLLVPILTTNRINHANQQKIIRLGIALQMTNILRDIKEDYQNGFIYLPTELMNEYSVSEADLAAETISPNLRKLIIKLSNQTLTAYDYNRKVLDLISNPTSHTAISLAVYGYRAILKKIKRQDFNVFAKRIYVSKLQKMIIYLRVKYAM
ncbi:phytoene/squalene synthase family protein [Fructilactobacillus vespulae]|uniref:phytoene/squalene synthase family protein n=1 Tax=Fructilactobacillus vespulae TaxID=1249630 RepID=UPI0039B5066F